MSQIYFVCSTPGGSGNLVMTMVRNLIGAPVSYTPQSFASTPPRPMTKEFWYDNIQVNDSPVIHVPFSPDYAKLNQRFPGCKIIVMTHTLPECDTLAVNLWEGFYRNSYEYGAEPFFREILESHSHLFSSTTLTPDQMTPIEIGTFIKILEYQKLIQGFFCLTDPNVPNVIMMKHKDLYFNTAHFRSQLESFAGHVFSQVAIDLHEETAKNYIENFFRSLYGYSIDIKTVTT
jgi:hypothetical protein